MRPRLHHTATTGWINDPYGLVWYDGAYHLFFQHVPGQTTWDVGCQWGHAESTDLLSWTSLPTALEPDESEDGCWSGSVVLSPDPVAFYTSVREPAIGVGRIRSVRLSHGSRSEALVALPPEVEAMEFRDPFVWRSGDGWRMLVGGGTPDAAAAWAFTSPDLATWTYAGVAASRSATETAGTWTGRAWECPQRLEIEGREVLVVSVWEPGRLHYLAYRLDGTWQRLTYGPSHYAGSVFTDADGRPGMVTWLREVSGDGWAGATSLPMSLSLDGDRLVASPHEALLSRRGPATARELPLAADIEWAATPGAALGSVGFAAVAASDTVALTAGDQRVDLPWSGKPLRLVLDGPVLELYGDHGIAALPVTRTGAAALVSSGPEPVVHSLEDG